MKVQIREDLTQKELPAHLTTSTFGILSPGAEPAVGHLVKPVTKPRSTKVEIRNKTITFPATEPGETSGVVSQGYIIQMTTVLLSLTLFLVTFVAVTGIILSPISGDTQVVIGSHFNHRPDWRSLKIVKC